MFGSGGEVDDDLGGFVVKGCKVVEGLMRFGNDFGNHESGKHTIAGRLVWKDNVAGLFPADFNVVSTHSFGDVGVADGGDFGGDVVVFGPVEEALVGHDGDSDAVEVEVTCEDDDDLVAVYFVSLAIDEKTAVAVAIKGDAEVEMVFGDEVFQRV